MGLNAVGQSNPLQFAAPASNVDASQQAKNSGLAERQQTSTVAQRESGVASNAKISIEQLSERGAIRQLLGHQPSSKAEFAQFVKDVVGPPAQTRIGKAVDKLLDFIQVHVGRAASTGRSGSSFIKLERQLESLQFAKHPSESRKILQSFKENLNSYANKHNGELDSAGLQQLNDTVDRLIHSESLRAVKEAGKQFATESQDLPKLNWAVQKLLKREGALEVSKLLVANIGNPTKERGADIDTPQRQHDIKTPQRQHDIEIVQKMYYQLGQATLFAHNLNFLAAVNEFREVPSAESAGHILREFIGEKGPQGAHARQPIDIEHEARVDLQALEGNLNSVDGRLFDAAFAEVAEKLKSSVATEVLPLLQG